MCLKIEATTTLKFFDYSRHVRKDLVIEDMNGLRKKSSEYFCENCFKKFIEAIDGLIKRKQ